MHCKKGMKSVNSGKNISKILEKRVSVEESQQNIDGLVT